MKTTLKQSLSISVRYLTLLVLFVLGNTAYAENDKTIATINTSLGKIEIELFTKRTPVTVKNFIDYAREGYYNNTIFHRVIPNFMIQGGGFNADMNRKATKSPIKNEANPFIPNLRGTIAMARTNDPHSATSQFFINVKDNGSLNKSNYNPGYAVFGKVLSGMPVADQISRVKTGRHGHMRDVPNEAITIKSVAISGPADKP